MIKETFVFIQLVHAVPLSSGCIVENLDTTEQLILSYLHSILCTHLKVSVLVHGTIYVNNSLYYPLFSPYILGSRRVGGGAVADLDRQPSVIVNTVDTAPGILS